MSFSNDQLSDEITKLNELRQSGVLTQEEFEKAKDKILNS
jgi:predicted Zn-dependent peptidase